MASTIIAKPISGGYSFTLTSKFGDILNQAEYLYGKRDQSFTILGLEFMDSSNPQIWYPQNCKHIVIQLNSKCLHDFNEGIFELAHETIHCLSPSEGKFPATVLEEGIATFFSINYTKKGGYGDFSNIPNPKYKNAFDKFSQFINYDNLIIKKVREVQPVISLIKYTDILKINNNVPEELAKKLTEQF